MQVTTKYNEPVLLKVLETGDYHNLLQYLNGLSDLTKSRFGPHPFTKEAIHAIYTCGEDFTGYIALEKNSGNIIAYAIVKKGFLQHDSERLQQQGLVLSAVTDCTFAPSVADNWHGRGIGNAMLLFIKEAVKKAGTRRIILWGGVQSANYNAVQFYSRNGFCISGRFEYNGANTDMYCILD